MKVNRTIFTLSEIFTHLSLAITLAMLENLILSRSHFEEGKKFLIENTFEFGENVEAVALATEQIEILDINIRTLTNVLLCHEAKVIEKRIVLGDLKAICLN